MSQYLVFVGPQKGLDGNIEAFEKHLTSQFVLLTEAVVQLDHPIPLLSRQVRSQEGLTNPIRVPTTHTSGIEIQKKFNVKIHR